jgi:hypothetical protein
MADGATGELVEAEVDGAAAVVARALGRVGNELLQAGRRRLPEHPGDRPRPAGGVHQRAAALPGERAVGAHQRLGGRPLHERPRLGVHRGAEEVVRGRVADLEPDRRVERGQLDQLRRAQPRRLRRRGGCPRGRDKLGDQPHRLDAESRRRRGCLDAAAAGGSERDPRRDEEQSSDALASGHRRSPSTRRD